MNASHQLLSRAHGLRPSISSPAAAALPTPWHPRCSVAAAAAACPKPCTHEAAQQTSHISRPHESCSRLQPQQHCRQGQQRRGQMLQTRAGPIDAAPVWTLDQIAGLVFGALMVAFYFSSNYVDVYIAKQQRRQLGLCDRCGGLNEPATCSQDGCPMKSKPQ